MARSAVDATTERVRALPEPELDVARFKELFGLTRRLAIPLLAHLAAIGVVVRDGNVNRIVRSDSAQAGERGDEDAGGGESDAQPDPPAGRLAGEQHGNRDRALADGRDE